MATAANSSAEIDKLHAEISRLETDFYENVNSFFLCSMALIIFFMQCGFAYLEAGAVRSKNTTNILIKNLLDSCICIIGYWAIGWALAYGESGDGVNLFIGHSQFFLSGFSDYPKFFFQYVFSATAATIVSGAVAERCEFVTYVTYCSVISTFVYPVLTHWAWSDNGWMAKGITSGGIDTKYDDFAGSGVVHLCGGSISFLAAWCMGPRIGKFPIKEEDESDEILGHSVPFTALGGFILMFGFLAFNGGSVASISNAGDGHTVALAMINTILSGSFAALIYLAAHYYQHGKWTLLLTINACLSGMVAACAGCNKMEPWGCMWVGVGAGLLYLALSKLMIKLKIDDPLDAFAVHAGGGFWGLVSASVISRGGVAYALVGVVGGAENSGDHLTQAFAIGKLRVSEEIEINGLDVFKHGEMAYPLRAYGHGWHDFERVNKFNAFSAKITVGEGKNARIMKIHPEMSIEQLASVYDRSGNVIPTSKKSRTLFTNEAERKKSAMMKMHDENQL
uniref:Ammonium transporter n=1 Tax=Caenorhabditis japonica TaxID=281687 RepID=A0A8R1DF73_CAEJA